MVQYIGSYTIMAKPIKSLELHYPVFNNKIYIPKPFSLGGKVHNATSTIPECLSRLLTPRGNEPGVKRTALLGIKLL